MKLVERPFDSSIILASEIGGHRSEGIHVSDVIRFIENKVAKYGHGRRPAMESLTDEEKQRMGVYVSMGFAWELVIRKALLQIWADHSNSARYFSPGELFLDGIIGTPDWFDVDRMAIEEFKATWRSARRRIDRDFWSWFVQIKSYCHMMNVSRARLTVFFVNGEYGTSEPQIRQWEMEFTQRELEENWMMIVNNSRAMEAER